MNLIGINGLKRSGKDTSYVLLNGLLTDVQRAAFADKLKQAAALSLGYKDNLIARMDVLKEEGQVMSSLCCTDTGFVLTGREFLQNFGRHHREVFGDSFWVDHVLPTPVGHTPGMTALDHEAANKMRLASEYPGVNTLCITDVRYPNEAQRVLDLGGYVLEIVRPGLESDGHESELVLPRNLVSKTIHNDKGLVELSNELYYWAIQEGLL